MHRNAFSVSGDPLGCTHLVQHKINTGDNPPIHQHPYRLSPPKRDLATKMIKELIDEGFVVPSNSPWASPIVIVDKKTGEKRFCVDYRKLNSITKRDVYPLPDIQLALDCLQGAQYFSLLDLKSGYYQIAMDPVDQEKTAFCTQDGLYEFTVMPFGLSCAPATFQRLMDRVISGSPCLKYTCVLVYIDDVTIFSKTFDDHLTHLRLVFERLKEANLTLKPSKCFFGKSEILYLGHLITREGQYPDENKLKAIKNYPAPSNLTDVRAFVALSSFYRIYIEGFAILAKPLTDLPRKDKGFKWGETQQQTFEEMKDRLTTPPVLAHFDPTRPIQLRCDASNYGLGCILLQKHAEKWKPIAFASRLMRGAELNYSISDKECLCIIYATDKFRPYLDGLHFEIVTDHCSLCWLNSKRKLPPRLLRYSLILQEFDFKITYKSGKHHQDCDALSRYPNEGDDTEITIDDDEKLFALLTMQLLQTNNEIRTEQNNDPYLRNLKIEIEHKSNYPLRVQRRLDKYKIEEGLVYKIVKKPYETLWNVVVPTGLRQRIISANHDDALAGHTGYTGTYQRVSSKYYWPKMTTQIHEYVQRCPTCQANKNPPRLEAGLRSITAQHPFEKIGIDLVCQLPRSDGKDIIIVCTDVFTRYAETRAVSNQKAITIARFLIEQILSRHGCPKIMISDRGRSFVSRTIKQINLFFADSTPTLLPLSP